MSKRIYVYLLNEGTDVWRPVNATETESGLYRIDGPMFDNEEWQFPPGSLVRCGDWCSSDGIRFLAATEIVNEGTNPP
jgi:hypothetical protein